MANHSPHTPNEGLRGIMRREAQDRAAIGEARQSVLAKRNAARLALVASACRKDGAR